MELYQAIWIEEDEDGKHVNVTRFWGPACDCTTIAIASPVFGPCCVPDVKEIKAWREQCYLTEEPDTNDIIKYVRENQWDIDQQLLLLFNVITGRVIFFDDGSGRNRDELIWSNEQKDTVIKTMQFRV